MAKKEETAVETAQKETVNAENEVKTEVVAENATTTLPGSAKWSFSWPHEKGHQSRGMTPNALRRLLPFSSEVS